MDLRAPNVLSLCAGYGGLDLGIKLAVPGARTICYVEREAYLCELLVTRMQEGSLADAPVWTDVATFPGREWRGVVDLIAAGYPCQPFSVAGRRRGEADERHLWPHVARIIGECEPAWVFLENVGGHLGMGYPAVAGDLAALGYRAAEGLCSAAAAGASHLRERLFVLAVSERAERRAERPGRNGAGEGSDGDGQAPRGPGEPEPLLAHAEGLDRQGRPAAGAGPGGSASGEPDLADAVRREHAGWPGVGRDAGEELPPASGGGGLGLFPPGPGDRAAWERVLGARPDLAPAVEPGLRGVADGRSSRLDRLRALGNGVVPVVAAHALLTLYARLQRGDCRGATGALLLGGVAVAGGRDVPGRRAGARPGQAGTLSLDL